MRRGTWASWAVAMMAAATRRRTTGSGASVTTAVVKHPVSATRATVANATSSSDRSAGVDGTLAPAGIMRTPLAEPVISGPLIMTQQRQRRYDSTVHPGAPRAGQRPIEGTTCGGG